MRIVLEEKEQALLRIVSDQAGKVQDAIGALMSGEDNRVELTNILVDFSALMPRLKEADLLKK